MVSLYPNEDQEVTFKEPGTAKFYNINITGVTGSQTITHVVPTGKKWIVKAMSTFLITATSSVMDTFMFDTGTNKMLIWTKNPTTGATESLITGLPNVSMEPDWEIRISSTLTGTGDLRSFILVQEFDA